MFPLVSSYLQVYIFPEIGTHDITDDVKRKIELHCKEELAKYQSVMSSGVFDELYPKKRSNKSCAVGTNLVSAVANTNVDNLNEADADQDVSNDCFLDDVTSLKPTRNNTGCIATHQWPTEVSHRGSRGKTAAAS